jgi:transcriptional regulator with XRE-family HTH domain
MKVEELEKSLGEGLRELRVGRRLTQRELAEQANVSLGALQNLERGSGSTTTTLVRVLRALGQEQWIESLRPSPVFNPLEILESRARKGRATPRGATRVRHRKATS